VLLRVRQKLGETFMVSRKSSEGGNRLDQVVASARQQRQLREQDYRELSLKMYPWVCGRCGREFTRANLHELTVHHRDHDHDNNPPDGSNWELLCLYCHDNEHSRHLHAATHGGVTVGDEEAPSATHQPFADLKRLLNGDSER
jgi:hypothetical protein